MTFLIWHRTPNTRIASPRLVLRAAEVPPLHDAHALCADLAQLRRDEADRIAAAAAQAAAQAHTQGLEAGRAAASDEIAATLVSLAQTAEQQRKQLRNEIGTLALQVVRKLLGNFADDAVLAALAETAAREALPAQQVAVIVHPDLRDAVQQRLGTTTDVRGDPACARDACRLETEHGSIDASLERQLQRLAQAWSEAKP
jgi:flagellar biosynthesis/type III secretory pathway protein FliH